LDFVEHCALRPVIDSSHGLDEVPAALDRLASGRQFGKVCLQMNE